MQNIVVAYENYPSTRSTYRNTPNELWLHKIETEERCSKSAKIPRNTAESGVDCTSSPSSPLYGSLPNSPERSPVDDEVWIHEHMTKRGREPMKTRSSDRLKKRKTGEDKDDPCTLVVDLDYNTDLIVPEERPKRVPSAGPRYFKGKGKNKGKLECVGEGCLLCKHGTPFYLHKSTNPGWRETVLAVFEFFPTRTTPTDWRRRQREKGIEVSEPEKTVNPSEELDWLYFPDSYAFLEYHWDILCPPQHLNRTCTSNVAIYVSNNVVVVGTNWRKTIQDTLSHNRTFFVSGKDFFGKTGFWRVAEKSSINNWLNGYGDGMNFARLQEFNQHKETEEQSQILPCLKETKDNVIAKDNVIVAKDNAITRDTVVALVAPAFKPERQSTRYSKLDLLLCAIDQIESMDNMV